MSAASAKLLVSVGEKCACVKITGRANFNASLDFRSLVNELSRKGCAYFLLDLTECVMMDSTFLGVLASIGLKMKGPQTDQMPKALELYRPNEHVAESLETLGVMHLFQIRIEPVNLADKPALCEVTPGTPTSLEITRNCLEAHKLLMELDPANVDRFKDVTAYMQQKLEKMKSGR
jgi:anti-anti-sigma regulatory factor